MQRGRDARSALEPASSASPVRTVLTNADDMAFTGAMTVSGQKVHPIMDTGSFELVLFAKDCTGCTDTSKYFDPSSAKSDYEYTDLSATQAYGSGETKSQAVYANVRMSESGLSIKVKKQVFWLADEVDMDFVVSGDFSGVFGLGPPASALTFALDDATYVREAGADSNVIASLERVVELENQTAPWLLNAECTMFSVCIEPGYGQNGVLVYNDAMPDSSNWIATNGEFWQVALSTVTIGTATYSSGATTPCSAIMDSGTSFIGVPSAFLDEVSSQIEALVAEKGCDDLSAWPVFEITLGDQTLSLSPSSYVANYDFSFKVATSSVSQAVEIAAREVDQVTRLMPHLDRFRALSDKKDNSTSGPTHGVCAPAMFVMDSSADEGSCEFLFGLPLFREYYTTHKYNETGHAESMLFSKADDKCMPSSESDLQASHKPTSPLRVDPRKIRFPSMVLARHRRQAKGQAQLSRRK